MHTILLRAAAGVNKIVFDAPLRFNGANMVSLRKN